MFAPATETILNTSEVQTKSSHGGRRVGAGRKPDPNSIRGTLKQAVEGRARGENWTHSFTKWEVERDNYISNHAHSLVSFLSMFPDAAHPFVTRHAAYALAHAEKSQQLYLLHLTHPHKLFEAYELGKDSDHEITRYWSLLCGYVLEHGEMRKVESAAQSQRVAA